MATLPELIGLMALLAVGLLLAYRVVGWLQQRESRDNDHAAHARRNGE